jgi:hypothetical protein
VQEGLDFSTDIGRHMLRSMLSWAEWEFDRTRSNWRHARERAVSRGVWVAGRPVGYRRKRDGRLAVDPVEGPVVSELFRRRAEGARLVDLRRYAEETGVRTATGLVDWPVSSLRSLLRGRVYRGEAKYGQVVNRRAHPPLTDESTWQLAQLHTGRLPPRRSDYTPLLRGVLRCAGCQRLLQTTVRYTGSSSEYRVYLCRRAKTLPPCPAPAMVVDSLVEPYVEAVFWQELPRVRRKPTPRRIVRLTAEVARRERELDAYRDNPGLPLTLGDDRFADGLAVRMRRLEQARLELARAKRNAPATLPSVSGLRERWPSLTVDQRREHIAGVIECVFVHKSRGDAMGDRAFVCLRGRAPKDLPPDNPRGSVSTRPFDHASCPPPARLRKREPDWPEARLCTALNRFLEGRTRWPNFAEFQTAGLAPLYAQVERHAGQRHWATLNGLCYDPPGDQVRGWTEERIRAELGRYLKKRTSWPSSRQFKNDGRSKLRNAVKWLGGPEHWAQEMGVRFGPRQRPFQPWTYARIKSELAALTDGRDDWPSHTEFVAAGRLNLYETIRLRNLREQLADELRLRLPPRRHTPPRRWTEPAIRAALDALTAGRDNWPSRRDFDAANLTGLYVTLYTTGTRDEWARRYGLPVRRRGGQK